MEPRSPKMDDWLKSLLSNDRNVWLLVCFVLIPTIAWLISITSPRLLLIRLFIGVPFLIVFYVLLKKRKH
jgi:hypothetical protein